MAGPKATKTSKKSDGQTKAQKLEFLKKQIAKTQTLTATTPRTTKQISTSKVVTAAAEATVDTPMSPTTTSSKDKRKKAKKATTAAQTARHDAAAPAKAATANAIQADKAPLPGDGINVFIVPKEHREAFGASSMMYLRPSKDMKLGPNEMYAVRCNEKFEDMPIVINGERGYVRDALLRAGKIFFYRCPGSNPILVMSAFAATAWSAPAGTRNVDAIADRTTTIRQPFTATSNIPFTTDRYYVRATILSHEIDGLVQLLPEAVVGTRVGHVEGTLIVTLAVNGPDADKLRATKIPFMPLKFITSSLGADCKLTIRTKEERTPKQLMDICGKIQLLGSACAIFSTHKSIRVCMPNALTTAMIRTLRLAVETKLEQTMCFTDVPLGTWNSGNTITTEETLPEPTEEQKSKGIIRILRAEHHPLPGEFAIVTAHLKCTVLAYGTSKFTDTVMSALVVFKKEEKTRVEALGQTEHQTTTGSWYLCTPDSHAV